MFINVAFRFSTGVANPATNPPCRLFEQQLKTIGVSPCFVKLIERCKADLIRFLCKQFSLLQGDEVLKMLVIGFSPE